MRRAATTTERPRGRRRVGFAAGLVAVIGLLFVGAVAFADEAQPGTGSDAVAEAQSQAQNALPALLAPSSGETIDGQMVDPQLNETGHGDGITSVATPDLVQFANDPSDGFSFWTDKGFLQLTPTDLGDSVSQAQVVGPDTLLYANSGAGGSDTFARATATGAKVVTQIPDAGAAESYSWKVDLPPGETLQQLDNGDVAVVGTLSSLGGDEQPSDGGADGAASGGNEITDAETQLEAGRSAVSEAQTRVDGDVVAVIAAPWAVDATGQRVPVSLSASDGTVTMTLDLHDSGLIYPIEADPAFYIPSWWTRAETETTGFVDQYGDGTPDRILNRIDDQVAAGDDNLVLDIPIFEDNLDSGVVRSWNNPPSGLSAPSDAHLIEAISYARSYNMKVTLKPHLAIVDGSGDATEEVGGHNVNGDSCIGQMSDSNNGSCSWYASWRQDIEHYADLGDRNQITRFVIGTEFSFLTDSSFDSDQWNYLITDLNNMHTSCGTSCGNQSQLFYATNWNHINPATGTGFFSNLDWIGVDAYFPLLNDSGASWGSDPSVAQLERGWLNAEEGGTSTTADNAINQLHSTFLKPIVFSEIGYQQLPTTADAPYGMHPFNLQDPIGGSTAFSDPNAQNRAVSAAYCHWTAYNPAGTGSPSWFKGFWWWADDLTNRDSGGTNYDLSNASVATITQWNNSSATAPVTCPDPAP
jgi:hypothetical protein